MSASQILDEEEDKYRRRDGFQRLTGNTGDASGASDDKRSRTKISYSKLFFLAIILFAAVSLIYIALTLNTHVVVE